MSCKTDCFVLFALGGVGLELLIQCFSNIYLSYNLVILLLGVYYPREMKIYIHKKTMGIFIAALFLIGKKLETTQMSSNRIDTQWITA